MLNINGDEIRDIEIDELTVSFGGYYGKVITLTKNNIKYHRCLHSTIAYMDMPKGYFDNNTIVLSKSEFKKISDKIHNAGLLHILSPNENMNLLDGAVYETLHCTFDDGSCYHYSARRKRTSDIFNSICNILSECCNFANLFARMDIPNNKIVPTYEDVEKEAEEVVDLLRTVNELKCNIKKRISFLECFGELSNDAINELRGVLTKIAEAEIGLRSNISVYDIIKVLYIQESGQKQSE